MKSIISHLSPLVLKDKRDCEERRGDNTSRGCESFKGVGSSSLQKVDPSLQRWKPSLANCHVEYLKKASASTSPSIKRLPPQRALSHAGASGPHGPGTYTSLCLEHRAQQQPGEGSEDRGMEAVPLQGFQRQADLQPHPWVLSRALANRPLWLVSPLARLYCNMVTEKEFLTSAH